MGVGCGGGRAHGDRLLDQVTRLQMASFSRWIQKIKTTKWVAKSNWVVVNLSGPSKVYVWETLASISDVLLKESSSFTFVCVFLFQARGKKRQKGWFPASNVKILGSNSGKSTPASQPGNTYIYTHTHTHMKA